MTKKGAKVSNAQAYARAAQMSAEMLGLACHQTYYDQGKQTVLYYFQTFLTQAFVVHIAGLEASIYWADLPSDFLRTVHTGGIENLSTKIPIQHTAPLNLLHPETRTQFIKDFVYLLRYIAAGYANIGHLRRPGSVIHRFINSSQEEIEEPPQNVLDEDDLVSWRENSSQAYSL